MYCCEENIKNNVIGTKADLDEAEEKIYRFIEGFWGGSNWIETSRLRISWPSSAAWEKNIQVSDPKQIVFLCLRTRKEPMMKMKDSNVWVIIKYLDAAEKLFICTYIHMHIHIYKYMYTCVYIYLNTYVCILCRSFQILTKWQLIVLGENWENFITLSFQKNRREHILNVNRKRWERPEFLNPGHIQHQEKNVLLSDSVKLSLKFWVYLFICFFITRDGNISIV